MPNTSSRGHLYHYHLVHQCLRCKTLFVSQEELEIHTVATEACEVKISGPVEGFNQQTEKQLRSRKKDFPGQTGAEKWMSIYKVLFPGEQLPQSPCELSFEQEDLTKIFVIDQDICLVLIPSHRL